MRFVRFHLLSPELYSSSIFVTASACWSIIHLRVCYKFRSGWQVSLGEKRMGCSRKSKFWGSYRTSKTLPGRAFPPSHRLPSHCSTGHSASHSDPCPLTPAWSQRDDFADYLWGRLRGQVLGMRSYAHGIVVREMWAWRTALAVPALRFPSSVTLGRSWLFLTSNSSSIK